MIAGPRWNMALLALFLVAGCVLLVWTIPSAHPAAQCNIRLDREQSIMRAQEISAALGVDTTGWTPEVAGDTDYKSARFALRHTADPASRRFSVVFPKIAFAAPRGTERVIVALSATGDLNRWQRLGDPSSKASDTGRARKIAEAARTLLAGADREAFQLVTDAADSKAGLTFAWERPGNPGQRLEAIVDGRGLLQVELKPQFPRDEQFEARKRIRTWFEIAAVAIDWIAGTVIAAIVVLYWAVRRGIQYRFVSALLGIVALQSVITWLNYHHSSEVYDSLSSTGDSTPPWIQALLILVSISLFYFVLSAAMDAVGDGVRLAALRSLFSSSLVNRRVGSSVLAGLLCGPLIAALPLWIFSWHIGGSESTGDLDAGLFYAEYPALQAVNVLLSPVIIGLFGFGAGFLTRHIRLIAAREAVLFIAGILLFTTTPAPSETSPAGFLLSGCLLYGLYYALYRRSGVLAALSGIWCAAVLWNAGALLLQPARSLHVAGIETLLFVAMATGVAGLVAWRGRDV